MGTKSRESIYGASARASEVRAAEARRQVMLAFQGPVQPSPALGDALNAGYTYLEVKCLGCEAHQTVALDIVHRPKRTPVRRALHALQIVLGAARLSLQAQSPHGAAAEQVSAQDPPSNWWPGER
jgi:hypothetical protein